VHKDVGVTRSLSSLNRAGDFDRLIMRPTALEGRLRPHPDACSVTFERLIRRSLAGDMHRNTLDLIPSCPLTTRFLNRTRNSENSVLILKSQNVSNVRLELVKQLSNDLAFLFPELTTFLRSSSESILLSPVKLLTRSASNAIGVNCQRILGRHSRRVSLCAQRRLEYPLMRGIDE